MINNGWRFVDVFTKIPFPTLGHTAELLVPVLHGLLSAWWSYLSITYTIIIRSATLPLNDQRLDERARRPARHRDDLSKAWKALLARTIGAWAARNQDAR